jgi:NAD+ diphosphatase
MNRDILVFHDDNILVASGNSYALPKADAVQDAEKLLGLHLVIGEHDAWMLKEKPEISGYEFLPLRRFFAFADEEAVRHASHAYHVLKWDRLNGFCGHCGGPMKDKEDELAKVCTLCGSIVYPRISPAVITLIRKGDSILLAHNAKYRAAMFSLIAGFVEAGETLEQTVARETREEVGIEINNIRYAASQPWPFPDSLMIGFTADYASGEIKPDAVEIMEAHWFTRDALPEIPLKGSLSRSLIDSWLAST